MNFVPFLVNALFVIVGFISFMSCEDEKPVVKPAVFVENTTRFEGDEGTTIFNMKIKADQNAPEDINIEYETQNDQAVAGEDFVYKAGMATIPVGAREVSITIEILADTIFEGDENFKIVISSASNAEITGSTGIGTIRNDDVFTSSDDDGYSTPTAYPGYTLVWADEFEGTQLNTQDWNFETGNHGWGNNESQDYLSGSNNAYLSNGKLVIEAKKESSNGSDYTSARITTQGKRSFQYGRIDIRAKLPQGQGIWPALWMLGENFSSVGWPACGEIDIMELVGHEPESVHGTIHWEDQGHASYGGGTSLPSGIFADEYHVFSLIWDMQSINWYVDDNLFNSADITPAGLSEFRKPFFFIFNIAVGGNWPGYPDATTVFPQRMEVDYIRVFQ